ncbi:hypothetical protein [Niabella hibiscisoli]|nr:hypothetical protein [Niabella hibiscisoli]MCH5720300.1 hypothetical protein [Niabella hibiscisoli]
MQRFTPVTQNKLRPGVWIYDLGQNFSGIPYIEVQGKRVIQCVLYLLSF